MKAISSDSARERAFASCVSLLRRGVVSGGDMNELVLALTESIGCVGLSLAAGYRLAPVPLLHDVDPAWPGIYLEHAPQDPGPAFLAQNGPYSVFSVATHSKASDFDLPLYDAFRRMGFRDGAIARAGSSDVVLVAYRPRELPLFDDVALARVSSLLPLMEIALSGPPARRALEASRSEARDEALSRLHAYAVLERGSDGMTLSRGAERLLAALFDSFGPRGRRRVERAIRLAHARFVRGEGTRVFRLRHDLVVALDLLPREGSDAALLATFSRTEPASPDVLLPCDELLSPTQRRVARDLVAGCTVPVIAARLGCSSDAVKTHVREIYRRLGVASRPELASLYAQCQVPTLNPKF